MDKKKLVKKVQTVQTIKDFHSSVIMTGMDVLFASYNIQLASSGFTSGFHWRQTQPLLRSNRAGVLWLS